MFRFASICFYLGMFAVFVSGAPLRSTNSIAYANALARRDGRGTCSKLTVDDLKRLPGWSKLEAEAKKRWGGGSYNLVLNPPEYTDGPASVCTSTDTSKISLSGNPNCRTQKQSLEGTLVGSGGFAELVSKQGTDVTQRSQVTKESSIASGMSVTAHIGVPNIAEVTAEMSVQTSMTNSLTKGSDSKTSNVQSQKIRQKAPAGKTCHLEFTTKTCDYSGTGSVRFYATGFVWFNFDKSTQGHYKWPLSIEEVLPDINDRSSTMDIAVSGSAVNKAHYKGVCKK